MASKQAVSVNRVLSVFKKGGKGWDGARPGIVTKVWGPAMCNVTVTMDAGDVGFGMHTQHTSVEVFDAGEGPKTPADGQTWAEWPTQAGATGQTRQADGKPDDRTKDGEKKDGKDR